MSDLQNKNTVADDPLDIKHIDLSCIYQVINLIDNKYNQAITIKEIEDASHYSYRNIQRIFKYTCGETIGAYQKRLKLENAYKLLLYTKESLTHIALEVGFDNSASFSKAFRLQYGVSPKEARVNKIALFAKQSLLPVTIQEIIKPEILYIPGMKVYYQSIYTEYVTPKIEKIWSKLMEMDFATQGANYYGLIVDESLITDDIHCRYDACISLSQGKMDLPNKMIFASKYARFLHHGSYNNIEETYAKIYSTWILSSKLEFSSSPILEHYIKHDSNTGIEDDFLTAILIPIKS